MPRQIVLIGSRVGSWRGIYGGSVGNITDTGGASVGSEKFGPVELKGALGGLEWDGVSDAVGAEPISLFFSSLVVVQGLDPDFVGYRVSAR